MLNNTITNAFFISKLNFKEFLIIIFISIFDKYECREEKKHVVFEIKFEIILNNWLILRQSANFIKLII